MEITKFDIKLENKMRLKAFAKITLDDVFVVQGLKIVQGKEELIVTMSECKLQNGSQLDIAHLITNDFRLIIREYVLANYIKVMNDTEDNKLNQS